MLVGLETSSVGLMHGSKDPHMARRTHRSQSRQIFNENILQRYAPIANSERIEQISSSIPISVSVHDVYVEDTDRMPKATIVISSAASRSFSRETCLNATMFRREDTAAWYAPQKLLRLARRSSAIWLSLQGFTARLSVFAMR